MMKVRLVIMMILFGTIFKVSAAENTSEKSKTVPEYQLSAGLSLSPRVGINTGTTDGVVNNVFIDGTPDILVTTYLPLLDQSLLGFHLDFGYSTYSFGIGNFEDKTKKNEYSLHYFSFSPYFCLAGVNIGMNIGIPMGGKYSGNYNFAKINISEDISNKSMETLTEVRIGGTIPLYKNDFGRLNLTINAGYCLAPLNLNSNNLNSSNFYEVKPASLSLGVSYLVNIMPLY